MKKLLVLLVVLLTITTVFAEISIKGDARIRPRLDQMYDEDGKTSQDLYYMYWARLWIDAKLTDGWYFSTKLAADGPGDFIGRFGDPAYAELRGDGGDYDSWAGTAGNQSGFKGVLTFAEMHFGRKTEKMGFSMGILPLSGLGNPEYDLHFFPLSTSDIPYTIMNAATAAGIKGYYKFGNGTLNTTITVDDNTGNREIKGTPRDQYSVMANYAMKFGELGVAPTFIYTSADEDLASPLTAGVNSTLPKIAGFGLSAGAYFTTQAVEKAGKYSGFMGHVKAVKPIGPGTLVAWADFKSIDVDGFDDNTNTALLWFMYKYVVYKSDVGNFSISPTFRRIMQNTGNVEFARNKIELTMHLTFK